MEKSDLAIPILGIYSRDTKILIKMYICTQIFITSITTIARYGFNLCTPKQKEIDYEDLTSI